MLGVILFILVWVVVGVFVPPDRNVSMILRHFSSEFSEQYYRSHAVDMWTTAKRHSCPHTHSDYDFPFFFGGLIQTASGN